MEKTGQLTSPLHSGKAPGWLFERMKMLARFVLLALREDYESEFILEKLSNPLWFQALGCLLGFDWHSSGLTTTVCGALKEAVIGIENELGLFIAGGKGKAGLQTPDEIMKYCEITGTDACKLIYASKISAKVDSAAIQDGYRIYHHTFIFTPDGKWAVIQQGMSEETATARRYHWLWQKAQNFTSDPHSAIISDKVHKKVLNLVAKESEQCRKSCVELARNSPFILTTREKCEKFILMPSRHSITRDDINPEKIHKILLKTYQHAPENFEQLLMIPKIGEKSLRALALLSEILYGTPPSFVDPARFSYAHGGKDRIPYPVDKKIYDSTINTLKRAVLASKLGNREKLDALKKLATWYEF